MTDGLVPVRIAWVVGSFAPTGGCMSTQDPARAVVRWLVAEFDIDEVQEHPDQRGQIVSRAILRCEATLAAEVGTHSAV